MPRQGTAAKESPLVNDVPGNDNANSQQRKLTTTAPQKTLIIYSGPTSLNRLQDKNGMYIDNMNYFLSHGISCKDNDGAFANDDNNADKSDSVIVSYVFVVTQDVADYYTAGSGLIAKKIQECERYQQQQQQQQQHTKQHGDRQVEEPFIKVIVRQDRCYDMESMRVVLEEIDVEADYDNLLFLNCGLVGPKCKFECLICNSSICNASFFQANTICSTLHFHCTYRFFKTQQLANKVGPGSPKLIPSRSLNNNQNKLTMIHYSHWSQLYTSRLSDSLRLVGHSVNTHFHTYFPHVQSFLYAIRTGTVPILLSSGAIYDCGLTQEQLAADTARRFELINRYEVGMSTQLLKRGYEIGTPFINRWDMGNPLVLNQNSTQGTELDDSICDIWYEDGVRNLTVAIKDRSTRWWNSSTDNQALRKETDSFEYHKWDILPWDYFIFFKVSRLVPEDIQRVMQYNDEELKSVDVEVISNDPRKSPSEFWQRKTGVYVEKGGGVAGKMLMLLLLFVLYAKRRQVSGILRVIKHRAIARTGRDD